MNLYSRPKICSFALGILLTFSFPPFGFFPCLISLPLFLSIIYRFKNGRQLFLSGFCFGYGHFLSSLYWIAHALTIDIKQFGWLIPFTLFLIPAAISFFIGIMSIITKYFQVNRLIFVLIFCSLWLIFEQIRSYTIFPFPWQLLGYAGVSFGKYFMQGYALLGVSGIGFIIALSASSIFTKNRQFIITCITLLVSISIYGFYRIDNAIPPKYSEYKVRLIQPNLPHHLGDPNIQKESLFKLLELSTIPNNQPSKTVTIWPESAFPYPYSSGSDWNAFFRQTIGNQDYLIFGADRHEYVDNNLFSYNSIISLSQKQIEKYDKILLVPFGEYIPLRNIFPYFIKKVAYGIGDFTKGKKVKNLRLYNDHFIPLICYEVIFPLHVVKLWDKNNDFMINITNDSWFGDTIGPHQYLNMAKVRAVELNMPLIRVANTGISAIIDAYGNIVEMIPLNQEGVIERNIPLSNHEETFYHKFPHLIFYLVGLIVALTALLIFINKKHLKEAE